VENKGDILSRIQACLLGVQIGDAMGMPWEMMAHEEIMQTTGGKGVTGFSDPVQRKLKETIHLKAGDTTDDWQLTRANVISLVRCKGYNPYDIALEHVRAYETCNFGWGGTTRRAIEEFKEFFDSRGTRGRSPIVPVPAIGGKRGAGNGAAMKIAPLAIYNALEKQDFPKFMRMIEEHAKMTHPNIHACSAAQVLAFLICVVLLELKKEPSEERGLSEFVIRAFKYFSANKEISFRLRRIAIRKAGGEFLLRINELREEIGTGCFSPESVMFAIAVSLRNPVDFRAGVLEAINSGGDTDSTASMVGALIGANCGLEGIPEEWRNFRPEYRDALELGEKLYDTFKNK